MAAGGSSLTDRPSPVGVLTDPIERRIAQYLFFFGSGETIMRAELDDEGRPIRVDLVWSSPAGPESPMVESGPDGEDLAADAWPLSDRLLGRAVPARSPRATSTSGLSGVAGGC